MLSQLFSFILRGHLVEEGGVGREEDKELLKDFCVCIPSATHLYWYAIVSVPALYWDWYPN